MLTWFVVALAAPVTSSANGPGVDRPVLDLPGAWERDGQASNEVVGGQREVRFGATVALTFPQSGAFCSASMITPRVALTAGHCVNEQGITPELVATYAEVHWGPDALQPTQKAKIIAAHPHPGYALNGNIPTNDVAILEIEPVEYTPTVWINEEPITTSNVGEEFTVVGFGINENGDSSSGRKRSAVVTVDEFQGDFIISDADTNPRNANVCSGDSGGPMYGETADGRYLQFGVHSWSQPPVCRGLAGSTDVSQFTGFIKNQVEQIHGSDDMCENRGANTDAYCDPECPDDVICAMQEAAGDAKACQTGSAAPLWFGGLALLGAIARRRR